MPKYLIERPVPGVGKLTADELQAAARKSNEVLDVMAGRAQWIQSYVSDDTLMCVYIAADEDAVREHAETSGFLYDKLYQVHGIIDPTTGEG
ncbi:DUF4242 domain-containing protein [Aldersonia sp. NBC_00410]|uniref:DUF4242 domain-containing protein n=1 Tax=Aldersonia sp. NBC_00410 TaxID=2975954 RepID=UPI0022575147|nr:DUF4242 domain-containing protein [Aldersonia sp. NBC_00410]MCX5045255.1 DUF4242 domain-containing protein [Aldersonia sp. NBC_00410]